MTEQFWIQIAIYIITGLVAVARVSFIVGKIEANMATKAELREKVNERDGKLDKISKWVNDDFVRKDMCSQSHQFVKEEIRGLDDDAKTFRHEMLNIVQKISLTLEEHKDRFAELKELILKK